MARHTKVTILRWRSRVQSPKYWLKGGFRAPFGSCYMRADQLIELMAPYVSDKAVIRSAEIGPSLPLIGGARSLCQQSHVVILTKHAAERISADVVADLRRTGSIVGVDHVDSDFSKIDGKPFDFHISATQAGKAEMEERFRNQPVFRLDHHADPRIRQVHTDFPGLSAVYLGKPANCRLPPGLSSEVTMLRAVTNPQMEVALRTLSAFNFHYAMRSVESGEGHIYKPFTKGFNSAAAGANILVGRDTDDATHFLGSDYPYLVSGNDDKSIYDTYNRAKDGFNSPEWHRGLDAIRALRDSVSPRAIAEQFMYILQSLRS